MSVEVENRIRQLVTEMVECTPVAAGNPSDPPLVDWNPSAGSVRRGRVLVAAALLLLAGAAVLIARSGNSAVSTDPADGLPAALVDVTSVADREWVVATWLPDGVEFELATEFGVRGAGREVIYRDPTGDRSVFVQLLSIEDVEDDPSSVEVVAIGDAEWLRHRSLGLMRSTGDVWVAVRDFGLDPSDLTAVVESLVVVASSELPRPPLTVPRGDGAVVGQAVWNDRTVELTASTDGRTYATGTDTGWTCCTVVDGDLLVVMTGGTSVEGGDSAFLYGIVDESVATVRLVLRDGSMVDLVPQDVRDAFVVDFVGGALPTTRSDPFAAVETIIAFAADGSELGRGSGVNGVLEVRRPAG